MDCNTPGLSVYHQLPELAHVHRVESLDFTIHDCRLEIVFTEHNMSLINILLKEVRKKSSTFSIILFLKALLILVVSFYR